MTSYTLLGRKYFSSRAGLYANRTFSASDTPHYENRQVGEANEAPFEVPESWEWCRLSEIANYGGGKTPSMDNKQYWSNGTNLWITSKDMKCERITDSMMKISDEALDIMTQYEPGTLLMVTRSGILRHSLPIAILEEKATVNQDLKTISLHLQEIHEYVYYAIKAREHYILKEYHKDGTTVDSINFEKFAEILLPIPPYDEQKRIVIAIKQWLSFIDQLEKDANDLETSIQQTKIKILDLAIHGKLVPQDPNDEPAIELLSRINPRFTPCDNAHYTIPQRWTYCCLSDIAEVLDNKRLPIKAEERKKRIQGKTTIYPYYGATGIAGYIDDFLLEGRFILLGEDGAPFLDKNAKKAYEVNGRFWVNNHAHILNPKIDFLYLLHYLNAIDYSDYVKGTTRLKLTQSDMSGIKIMLPPFPEQLRIVAKIEELFAILDKIQESIEA
ncbi:MAG: restriction endonuclease subunit S [Bacteroidaceae bacterium]|nr:restriction endonuclease subunit S [Bacteroidaceae bacterium]